MRRKITYSVTPARGFAKSRAELLSKAEKAFHDGQIEEADRLYQRLLVKAPNMVAALTGKAVTGTRLRGDPQEAFALLDRAAELEPTNSHVWQTRAAILNENGDFDGAIAAARRALQLDPTCALAFVNLTDSERVTAQDPVFALGEAALANPAVSDTNRQLIHFALGKAHQDCGAYDQAFAHFSAGNALKPEPEPIDNQRIVADRQRVLFSPEHCARLTGSVRTQPRPIFIVGMPRSGTTLLERMLAAHPEVSTAGERREFNHLSGQFYATAQSAIPGDPTASIRASMTRAAFTAIAKAYITPVSRAADRRSPNVIDKMPMNFWNLGLIAATFAEAPILHLRRHPLDTCLSNYIANFSSGMDYSTRLETLGAYFRLYDDLMCHWEAVFPGRIVHVDYEALVSRPDTETRRILAACGLAWDDACLTPERTEGVIATASRYQARQKINRGSIEKWRRYERHLAPLITALGGMAWIESYEARRRA